MATLIEKIGQMIMVGFQGSSSGDPEVPHLMSQIKAGYIGGVVLFGFNIISSHQIKILNHQLKRVAPLDFPLIIGVDQEGGKVQRLNSQNGHGSFLSAKDVCNTYTPQEAFTYYQKLAQKIHQAGFNANFAPVIDLEGNCPVIGKLRRSFDPEPEMVVRYAQSFIDAHRKYHLLTSLKHFPGHGFAQGDTHKGLVDITETFAEDELEPFYTLIERNYADMIMVGHLTHRNIDPVHPATLSEYFIGPLLREKGYEGVIISDDLHMGAILQSYQFEEIIIRAINAGIDILMFSKNPAAAGSYGAHQSLHDLSNIHKIILRALEKKAIKIQQINKAYERIKMLKGQLKSLSY